MDSPLEGKISKLLKFIFSDLPSTDLRLDSFCAYLLKNNEKERVLELCLLEQFSLPGLDAQNDQVTH